MNKQKIENEDYQTIGTLGNGAYGEVVLAKRLKDNQQVAIKIIDKKFLMKERKQYQVYIEKEMLRNLDHQGIVQLHQTFQRSDKLFMVLEYLEGGDLAEFLKLHGKKLTNETYKFYLAEILVVLEYLHKKGIAHRDVKPENLMLTKQGHLKLIDFGTASIIDDTIMPQKFVEQIKQIKQNATKFLIQNDLVIDNQHSLEYNQQERQRKATFVGTPEYVSPELLEDEICQYPADLWALGVICYKMYVGKTPFFDKTQYLIFQNVKNVQYQIPESVPADAADFIRKLLIRDPSKRLTAQELKSHPLFKGINFDKLYQNTPPQQKILTIKQVEKQVDPDLELGQKKKSKLKFFGVIQLKVGWFIYRPLDMVLIEGKAFMKLAFFDPETTKTIMKFKLDEFVEIYSPRNGVMQIDFDKKKKYVIKEVEHSIEKWLEVIEKSKRELKFKRSKQY